MDKRTIAVRLGLEAEKNFELECVQRDISCYKDIGSGQADYIIEMGSEIKRVQIKSSDSSKINNIPVKCSWGNAKSGWNSYTKKETDLIAVYIRQTTDWYIIPVEEVQDVLGFNISPTCRLNKYKNQWNLKNTKITTDNTNLFNQAKDLKTSGLSNTCIAARLGKSRSFIDRLLRKGKAGLKDRLSRASEKTLRSMYLKDKKTMDQISEELNISTWYLRKKFREFGIKVRANPNPNGNKHSTK